MARVVDDILGISKKSVLSDSSDWFLSVIPYKIKMLRVDGTGSIIMNYDVDSHQLIAYQDDKFWVVDLDNRKSMKITGITSLEFTDSYSYLMEVFDAQNRKISEGYFIVGWSTSKGILQMLPTPASNYNGGDYTDSGVRGFLTLSKDTTQTTPPATEPKETTSTETDDCDVEWKRRCCDDIPPPPVECSCEDAYKYKLDNVPAEVLAKALGIVQKNGQYYFDGTAYLRGYGSLTAAAKDLYPAFYAANGKWYYYIDDTPYESTDGLNFKKCGKSNEITNYTCKDFLAVTAHTPTSPTDAEVTAFTGLVREGNRYYYGQERLNAIYYYGFWLLEEYKECGRKIWAYKKDDRTGKYALYDECDCEQPNPVPTECNTKIRVCCDDREREYTVLNPRNYSGIGVGTYFFPMPSGTDCDWIWTDLYCENRTSIGAVQGTLRDNVMSIKPKELRAYFVGDFWLVTDGKEWYKVYSSNLCELIKCSCGGDDGDTTPCNCEELEARIAKLEQEIAEHNNCCAE